MSVFFCFSHLYSLKKKKKPFIRIKSCVSKGWDQSSITQSQSMRAPLHFTLTDWRSMHVTFPKWKARNGNLTWWLTPPDNTVLGDDQTQVDQFLTSLLLQCSNPLSRWGTAQVSHLDRAEGGWWGTPGAGDLVSPLSQGSFQCSSTLGFILLPHFWAQRAFLKRHPEL